VCLELSSCGCGCFWTSAGERGPGDQDKFPYLCTVNLEAKICRIHIMLSAQISTINNFVASVDMFARSPDISFKFVVSRLSICVNSWLFESCSIQT